jgi:hypothetical protein
MTKVKKSKTADSGGQNYKVPSGTIALLALYILLMVVLWGSAYLIMLSRGGTI